MNATLKPNTPRTNNGRIELKPCFCGLTPELQCRDDELGPYICVSCACGIDADYTSCRDVNEDTAKVSCAARWNERPRNSTALDDALIRLRASHTKTLRALAALAHPDDILRGPIVDGPELSALNEAYQEALAHSPVNTAQPAGSDHYEHIPITNADGSTTYITKPLALTRMAADAIQAEKVDAEATGDEGDKLYNRACDDCLFAVEQLANGQLPPAVNTGPSVLTECDCSIFCKQTGANRNGKRCTFKLTTAEEVVREIESKALLFGSMGIGIKGLDTAKAAAIIQRAIDAERIKAKEGWADELISAHKRIAELNSAAPKVRDAYVLVRTGVYDRGIFGVYLNAADAYAAVERAQKFELDDYHSFEVREFKMGVDGDGQYEAALAPGADKGVAS